MLGIFFVNLNSHKEDWNHIQKLIYEVNYMNMVLILLLFFPVLELI